jgi:hypothetical protein
MELLISSDGNNFQSIARWNGYYLNNNRINGNFELGGKSTYIIPANYRTANFTLRLRWVSNATINNQGCLVDDVGLRIFESGADNQYQFYQGTSMAAPHVAGLAALIWGYKPNLSVAEVKSTILQTGDSIPSLSGKTLTGKRINAYNALKSLGAPPGVTNTVRPTNTSVPIATNTVRPTSVNMQCNDVCTSDSQCTSSNSNYRCVNNFNFTNVNWATSNLSLSQGIPSTNHNKITSLSNMTIDGNIRQHLVANGEIYTRLNANGVWGNWSTITSNLNGIGSGTITSFNAHSIPNNDIQRYATRGGRVWFKATNNGTWVDVTNNISHVPNIGSGTITGYSKERLDSSRITRYFIKGGKLYASHNNGAWFDATASIPSSVPGTRVFFANYLGVDKSNTQVIVTRDSNGNGLVYERKAGFEAKRCRPITNPSSCTAITTPVPTNGVSPIITNTSSPIATNTSRPIISNTVRPTNTSNPSVSNTIRPIVTNTVRPTNTSTPNVTNTIRPTNTPPPNSIVCGPLDQFGQRGESTPDNKLHIFDFIAFRKVYQSYCSDVFSSNAASVQAYGPCGGRNIVGGINPNRVAIEDFINLRRNYNTASCAINLTTSSNDEDLIELPQTGDEDSKNYLLLFSSLFSLSGIFACGFVYYKKI